MVTVFVEWDEWYPVAIPIEKEDSVNEPLTVPDELWVEYLEAFTKFRDVRQKLNDYLDADAGILNNSPA